MRSVRIPRKELAKALVLIATLFIFSAIALFMQLGFGRFK